ncbi:hypothetical protein IAI10_05725 [Clostridium sp. 19966]|uniref:hypothetical protein n=1 Tax=Clostridium sp. 19966 TaxID=2768166 RepID=UPI0028DE65CF|nr:hypothetical protein [Clostridium sp. 19966]MDT8716147.1 hypothetical protein [Clostridium sp. 19966]
MDNVLFLTDYIEGQPVVASIRYEELMLYFQKKFNIFVVNDNKYGSYNSEFGVENFKFITERKIKNFKQKNQEYNQNVFKIKIKKMVKNKYIKKIYKYVMFNNKKFFLSNRKLLQKLNSLIQEKEIKYIFITVPDIYVIYIADYLKRKNKQLQVISEIRDLIVNKIFIENGIPKSILKNAEKIMLKTSNEIIALSDGIENEYKVKFKNNIVIIKNGYNEELFKRFSYRKLELDDKKTLIFSHVGSIYTGRNISEFIAALYELNLIIHKKIIFNIIGYVDDQGIIDISNVKKKYNNENVQINILGSMEHSKAIEAMFDSDILVIITHQSGSEYAIPGKTFEYIGACKPTIAVTKDLPLINLINGRYGECAEHNKQDIVEKIVEIIRKDYNFENREIYSRRIQASKIIDEINKN